MDAPDFESAKLSAALQKCPSCKRPATEGTFYSAKVPGPWGGEPYERLVGYRCPCGQSAVATLAGGIPGCQMRLELRWHRPDEECR